MFTSVQVGINFDRYDKIPVEISGNNPTEFINTFADAGLLETVDANVKKAKYFKPTPVQKYAIPAIMAGRDLMGCAQTGSGKTVSNCVGSLPFFKLDLHSNFQYKLFLAQKIQLTRYWCLDIGKLFTILLTVPSLYKNRRHGT